MPKKKTTKRYHHGDLRRELLIHASELLHAKGEVALSLRDLARNAGVSQAAPYRHFATKQALLVELAEEGFATLEERMLAAGAEHDASLQRLTALATAYLQLAAKRPHLFRMMFSADLGPSRVHEGVFRACDRVFAALVSTLLDGQKKNVFRIGIPEQQALLFWSTLHGFSMLLVDHRLEELASTLPDQTKLLHQLLEQLFAGLTRN